MCDARRGSDVSLELLLKKEENGEEVGYIATLEHMIQQLDTTQLSDAASSGSLFL